MKIKRLILIIIPLLGIHFSINAQNPKGGIIIVAPVAKLDSAQTISKYFQDNPDAGNINTAISEELKERGVETKDFMSEFMTRATANPTLLSRGDIIQYIIAQTKANVVIIPQEVRTRGSRGNSIKLTLTAYNAQNNKKLSSIDIYSGIYFTSNYVKLTIKALAMLPEEDFIKFIESIQLK